MFVLFFFVVCLLLFLLFVCLFVVVLICILEMLWCVSKKSRYPLRGEGGYFTTSAVFGVY